MVEYEGMFTIKSNLDKDKKEKITDDIKGAVAKEGGEIIDCNEWGKRKLGYRIRRQTEGLYILMHFKLDSRKLRGAEKAYNLKEDILKYLITKKR